MPLKKPRWRSTAPHVHEERSGELSFQILYITVLMTTALSTPANLHRSDPGRIEHWCAACWSRGKSQPIMCRCWAFSLQYWSQTDQKHQATEKMCWFWSQMPRLPLYTMTLALIPSAPLSKVGHMTLSCNSVSYNQKYAHANATDHCLSVNLHMKFLSHAITAYNIGIIENSTWQNAWRPLSRRLHFLIIRPLSILASSLVQTGQAMSGKECNYHH